MCLSNDYMIEQKVGNVEILKFRRLDGFENIIHAFSLKPLKFRNKDGMIDNYKLLFDAMNTPFESLVKTMQMHTDNILVFKDKKNIDFADINLDYLKDVDAIITNKSGITLATTCADCLCMILYDDKKDVIGNVHSGWRGTFKKISQKTVLKMIEEYGCDPADIMVFMAPSIRKCCFEVDVDVMEMCKESFAYLGMNDDIITLGKVIDGKQKYYIDSILINKLILKEVGILEDNIIDSQICSCCNSEKIHSRRADGEEYELGTLIVGMKQMED